mmetsp:Transcript_14348/g.18147  ORF Transcript_14348/g.18147 Transcript_14348/m.18147 type:complete len:80 (-) Transcript_14348:1023-1262(-)
MLIKDLLHVIIVDKDLIQRASFISSNNTWLSASYSVFFFFRKAANKLADAADTGGVFRFFLELPAFGDGVDLEFCFFKF